MANSQAGGGTILNDQEAAFAITIEHVWMAHLALLEDTLKLEEAV